MLLEEKEKNKVENHEKQESPYSYFYHTTNIDSFLIFIGICQILSVQD